MKVPTLFKEYIWLVETIKQAKKITFAEIREKWFNTDLSEGKELARSTFNRHKDAIADIFGIIIECDTKDDYRYYIDNNSVFRENSVQNWMLSTLSVNNVISESLSLQDRILLQPIPCNDYLQIVINAMKKKVRVEVTYRKYNSEVVSHVNFEPYCLKLFNQRWYVLAHFHRDATIDKDEQDYFATYSFDRIQSMTLTEIKFEVREDFDAQEYFGECYGIYAGGDVEAQRIVIRAYNDQRFYLRDLPLHHSQKELHRGDNYIDYEYYMRPTIDFCSHLLSFGKHVEVIEPQSLRENIVEMAKEIIQTYNSEK